MNRIVIGKLDREGCLCAAGEVASRSTQDTRATPSRSTASPEKAAAAFAEEANAAGVEVSDPQLLSIPGGNARVVVLADTDGVLTPFEKRARDWYLRAGYGRAVAAASAAGVAAVEVREKGGLAIAFVPTYSLIALKEMAEDRGAAAEYLGGSPVRTAGADDDDVDIGQRRPEVGEAAAVEMAESIRDTVGARPVLHPVPAWDGTWFTGTGSSLAANVATAARVAAKHRAHVVIGVDEHGPLFLFSEMKHALGEQSPDGANVLEVFPIEEAAIVQNYLTSIGYEPLHATVPSPVVTTGIVLGHIGDFVRR